MRRGARAKNRSQSAMEYLMTYGWAILIISVVLVVLYQLGVFSGSSFVATSCLAATGFSCTSPVMNATGYVQVSLGQVSSGAITITGLGCTNTTVQPTSWLPVTEPLQSSQVNTSSVFSCPGISNRLGASFTGYLWIQYNTATQSGLVQQVATISAQSSTNIALPLPPHVLYCVAGDPGGYPTNVVYAATLSGTTVNSWVGQSVTGNYPIPVRLHSCVNSGSDTYCVGGLNSDGAYINTVYAAPTSGTTVGPWTEETYTYPTTIDSESCATNGAYIYCVGGYTGSGYTPEVAAAPISGTTTGPWTSQSSTGNYPTSISSTTCVASSSYLYCIGGFTGSADTAGVFAAPISGTSVGPWTAESSTGNYPGVLEQGDCVLSSSYIYCIGGFLGGSRTGDVYSAPVGGATVGPWTLQSNTYPTGVITTPSCVVSGADLYCIGGNDPSPTSSVYAAPISGGTVGSFVSQTNNYPIAIHTSCVT